MKIYILALMATAILTACGTTGGLTQAEQSAPLAKNQSRLIFERDSSLLYMGARTKIDINGEDIGKIGNGGKLVHDTRHGSKSIRLSVFGSFQKYILNIETEPNQTYNFIISPNSKALHTAALFGVIGDAVKASQSNKTGYFSIELSEEE